MYIRVFIFFLCLIGFNPDSHTQTFKAGAAVRVITPDPLLPVSGGIGTPKPATIKQGDLYARALVLEKGETRIAIVNIDNLGWPSVLGNAMQGFRYQVWGKKEKIILR